MQKANRHRQPVQPAVSMGARTGHKQPHTRLHAGENFAAAPQIAPETSFLPVAQSESNALEPSRQPTLVNNVATWLLCIQQHDNGGWVPDAPTKRMEDLKGNQTWVQC